MQYLKQSTTVTVQLGPFLDEDDGKTAETGLTVEDTDVYLSKNGAAFANPNDTNNATHDRVGWYRKQIDTTDTGTLGRLIVSVHESGALPVWREFMVIPANEYDSLIAGSDALEVNVAEIEGADPTDTIRDSVVDDATRIDASDLNTHSALTAAAIVNEWETQSQADPTGFHVNLLEVEGGDATDALEAAAVAALVDANLDHLAKTATGGADMTTEVADDTILSRLLANGDTSVFDPSTDGLQPIRDAIVDANPQNHSATANNETTGTLDAGTYADTATVNTTYYQTSPAGAQVGGFGLNVDLTFNIGTGRVPEQLSVTGYFDAGAQRTVQVWAYDYNSASYVQLSSSINDFGNNGSNETYQYPMTNNMRQASDGEVSIRFTSESTNTGDDWYCDYVNVSSVAQGAAGLTADAIQQAVWARADSGHDEDSLGYNLSKTHLVHGDVVSATDASQFIVDTGVATNDAYNGMLITLEDKTDDHYETRRIVDYIGATKEVFVDRAFGFTPVASDDFYIMNAGYADVNVTHVGATAQTANDIGADVDAILTDTGELQTDDVPGLIAALNDPTAAAVRTEMDANSTQLAAIVADTNELQTDDVPGLIAALNDPTAAAVADAVWDEAKAGHVAGGSFGEEVQAHALSSEVSALNDPTAAAVRTEMDANSTQLAAIVADTNELQTDDVPGLIAALNDVTVTDVTQRQIPDSYAADGAQPTLEQALLMIWQYLSERAVSGTTVSVKKPDGSTGAMSFTLDDANDPSSITRSG